jgi:hypothetical protein
MKRQLFFAVALFGLLGSVRAQKADTTTKKSVENHLYKLNFLAPGLGYERSLSKNISLTADIALNPFGGFSGNSYGSNLFLGAGVNGKLQGRYYYNFAARKALNRNTSGNSANYFAAHLIAVRGLFDIVDPPEDANADRFDFWYMAGITWGLQRAYKSKLYINLELGLNYMFDSGTTFSVAPHLSFRLGYLLFRNHQTKK